MAVKDITIPDACADEPTEAMDIASVQLRTTPPMNSYSSQNHWSVRTVMRDDGRRAMTFWRGCSSDGRSSHAAKRPAAANRTNGVRLRVQFAQAELTGFRPVIQVCKLSPPLEAEL
jgi:hypothetical protein